VNRLLRSGSELATVTTAIGGELERWCDRVRRVGDSVRLRKPEAQGPLNVQNLGRRFGKGRRGDVGKGVGMLGWPWLDVQDSSGRFKSRWYLLFQSRSEHLKFVS